MANLFKQSRSKRVKSESLSKRKTSANAQVAGLRFAKQTSKSNMASSLNVADDSSTNNRSMSDRLTNNASTKITSADNIKTVTIDSLDWMGQGVVRGNPMYFVEGALPNEVCEIEEISRKKQVVQGKVTRVVTSSDMRIAPFCPMFNTCGGCQLQHIEPVVALEHRDNALKNMMQKQLGMQDAAWQPPLVGERPQYRRKARLAIDARNPDKVKLGFRAANSNKVVNITACPILVDPLSTLINPLHEAIEGFDSAKFIGHIVLIAGDDRAQVTVKHTKNLESSLLDSLADFAKANTVELVLEDKKGAFRVIHSIGTDGEKTPHKNVPSLTLSTVQTLSITPAPNDFIQINKVVNQKMIEQALEWLAPKSDERIADWFSGLGNFTLPIAKTGAQVQAIEGVADMVRRAQHNAQQQGIDNITWLHLDLANHENVQTSLKQGVDKVLLDPSREGALTVCHALVKAKPRTIVYVSCNPSTFSRDAKVLIAGGYEIIKAGVAEMFPFTQHMEMMALFTHKQQ